jgi:predicted component of type VI protein secretion system
MSEPSPPFVSVKLPAALVGQARGAAQTMRRSVASQIEYWATLGRALEHAGLTTADSHALIARQERAPYNVGQASNGLSPELDDLHAHVLALAKSGALAERAQVAVAGNKGKAARSKSSRKAA